MADSLLRAGRPVSVAAGGSPGGGGKLMGRAHRGPPAATSRRKAGDSSPRFFPGAEAGGGRRCCHRFGGHAETRRLTGARAEEGKQQDELALREAPNVRGPDGRERARSGARQGLERPAEEDGGCTNRRGRGGKRHGTSDDASTASRWQRRWWRRRGRPTQRGSGGGDRACGQPTRRCHASRPTCLGNSAARRGTAPTRRARGENES